MQITEGRKTERTWFGPIEGEDKEKKKTLLQEQTFFDFTRLTHASLIFAQRCCQMKFIVE